MTVNMKSPKAAFSTSPRRYQVFLSFRGIDVRKTFIGHLYKALDHAGFHPFMDEHGIEKGADIRSELEKAIRETRISIIVFSKNYASSKCCLEELVMILKRRSSGHVVIPVFYDVDPSEVRHQIGSFKEAFTRHEEKLKSETGERKEKLKDKTAIWRAALRKAANLSGMNLQNHANGNEVEFIQQIIQVIGDKLRRPVLDTVDRRVNVIYACYVLLVLYLEFNTRFLRFRLAEQLNGTGSFIENYFM